MTAFALVIPEETEKPLQPKPTKGELKRAKRLAMQPAPAEGTVLMQFSESAKSQYRERLFKRDPRCVYCNREVTPGNATAEHAIPRSRGGLNAPGNLWLACHNCNQLKGSKTPMEWLQELWDACVKMGFIDDDDEPAMAYAVGAWD